MRPAIFDYAIEQKDEGFDSVSYSYEEDVSVINGKKFFECSYGQALHLTKTNTVREQDDCSSEIYRKSLTKTDVARESDDSNHGLFMAHSTKTAINRESDDTASVLMFLTKTEVLRESDE